MNFKGQLFIVALLIFGGSCHSMEKAINSVEFTQQELLDDLKQLESALIKYHSGLFWHQSEAAFQSSIDEAKTNVNEGADFLTFYKQTGKILSQIGCGHTRQRLPTDRHELLVDSLKMLPVAFTILDNRIFVNKPIGSIKAGAELLALGNKSSKDILEFFCGIYPSDGLNTTGKDRFLSRLFQTAFPLYFLNNDNYVEARFKDGFERLELKKFDESEFVNPSEDLLSFQMINSQTSIITIRSFGSGYLRSSGFDYYGFLEESFTRLRTENIQKLIIDLRGNGGGDDNYGSKLISYLTDQPFKYFKSIEVNPGYRGWGNVKKRNNRFWVTAHSSLALLQPSENHFRGKVVLLVDGGTFSTAADVTAVAKNIGAATIIGEETGGGECGNTSGVSESITLTNSGIQISIPKWKYLNDLKSLDNCSNGVMPKIKVFDVPWTNEDEAMRAALSEIKM